MKKSETLKIVYNGLSETQLIRSTNALNKLLSGVCEVKTSYKQKIYSLRIIKGVEELFSVRRYGWQALMDALQYAIDNHEKREELLQKQTENKEKINQWHNKLIDTLIEFRDRLTVLDCEKNLLFGGENMLEEDYTNPFGILTQISVLVNNKLNYRKVYRDSALKTIFFKDETHYNQIVAELQRFYSVKKAIFYTVTNRQTGQSFEMCFPEDEEQEEIDFFFTTFYPENDYSVGQA